MMSSSAVFILVLVQSVLGALAARPAAQDSGQKKIVSRHNQDVDPRWEEQMFAKGEPAVKRKSKELDDPAGEPESKEEAVKDIEEVKKNQKVPGIASSDDLEQEQEIQASAEGNGNPAYWKDKIAKLEQEIARLKNEAEQLLKTEDSEKQRQTSQELAKDEEDLQKARAKLETAQAASATSDSTLVQPISPNKDAKTGQTPLKEDPTSPTVSDEADTTPIPIALDKDGELEDTNGPLKETEEMVEPIEAELKKARHLPTALQWFVWSTTIIIGCLLVFYLHMNKHKATWGAGTLMCICCVPGGLLALCLPIDESPPPKHAPIFDDLYEEEPAAPLPKGSGGTNEQQEVPADATAGTNETPSAMPAGVPGEAPLGQDKA